jgi:ComF family protein
MTSSERHLPRWAEAGLALLYPEVCQLCRSEPATAREGFVGRQCWSQVQFIRPPFCDRCGLPYPGEITGAFVCSNCHDLELLFSSARSAVIAKTAVLEAIHRFKYSRALWFENFLAGLLVREAVPVLLRGEPWHAIVPVPLHPLKEREREFNQSALLARRLGEATGIPCDETILSRLVPTATQTHLNRAQRAENMKNAIVVRPDRNLKGRRIVVVDDVFTTGATTNQCARALRRAGAAEVCVWTVARGL